MIHKIVASLFLICLFIAIPLSLMGIEKVELGEPFLAFMSNCDRELTEFQIDIPNIPHFEPFADASGFLLILNAFIGFFNLIISILNAFLDLVNVVLQLIEFIVIVVKNLIAFKDNLVEYQIPVS